VRIATALRHFTDRWAGPRGLLVLAAANVAIMAGLAVSAQGFQAPGGPSVVGLELTFGADRFRQALLTWSAAHDDAARAFKLSVATFDMVFPPVYAALLATAYTMAARRGARRGPVAAVQLAPWAAAGFDYAENGLLLWLLRGVNDGAGVLTARLPQGVVLLMSTCAALKFALLGLTAAAALLALAARITGRRT
jgi:hypothetical protein